MKTKRMAFLTALLLAGTALCAVGTAAEKDTLVVGMSTYVKSLDPQTTNDIPSSMFQCQMYEALFDISPDKKLVGCLAEKWHRVDDRTFEVTLRKGIKFHNGEELTSEDAVFTLHRMTEPLAAAIKAHAEFLDPNGLKVIDRYTFRMKSKDPIGSGPFLSELSQSSAYILNKKAVLAARPDYAKNPVGTGPFKYKERFRGERLVFERYDNYWGHKSEYKTLVFKTVPEANSRVIELETGNVDLAFDLPTSDFIRLKKEGKIDVYNKPGLSITYLGMNFNVKPFDNIKVRHAIAMAIDKKAALESAYAGLGRVPNSILLLKHSYYKEFPKYDEYNPTLAKKLLDEAGVKNLSFTIYTNENKQRVSYAQIIQEQLKPLGIEVKVQVLEWAFFLDQLRAGKLPVFIIGWGSSNSNPDPSSWINGPIHSKFAGVSNRVWVKDKKIDALLDKGMIIDDGPDREKAYVDIQERVNELGVWCFLCTPDELYGCRKGLIGVDGFLSSVAMLNRVRFAK